MSTTQNGGSGGQATAALLELDSTDFTARHPSWVDILAMSGQELFVIDGDALLSHVLDDPTLQLASSDESNPSYQLLYATYLVERFLLQLKKRDCIFDVVFFDSE